MNSNNQRSEIEKLVKKSAKILQYSTLFRLAISIIFNKFRIAKVIKSLPGTIRFGIACTLFSLIYKVSLTLIDKNKLFTQHRDFKTFLCCALSYIGLMIAQEKDQSIFKIIIYSRGVVSALKLGSETGFYSCIQPKDKRWFTVETLLSVISCVGLAYAYCFEILSVKKSFARTMIRATSLSEHEMRFFDSLRAVSELTK